MTSACVLLATESVANLGFFDLFSKSTLFVSAGVLARIASVLLGGGMRLFPGGSIHLRIAILFILGLIFFFLALLFFVVFLRITTGRRLLSDC